MCRWLLQEQPGYNNHNNISSDNDYNSSDYDNIKYIYRHTDNDYNVSSDNNDNPSGYDNNDTSVYRHTDNDNNSSGYDNNDYNSSGYDDNNYTICVWNNQIIVVVFEVAYKNNHSFSGDCFFAPNHHRSLTSIYPWSDIENKYTLQQNKIVYNTRKHVFRTNINISPIMYVMCQCVLCIVPMHILIYEIAKSYIIRWAKYTQVKILSRNNVQTPYHLRTYILHSKINQQSVCFVRKTCSVIITANVSRYNIIDYFNIMKNINYHKKTFELYKQPTQNKTIFFLPFKNKSTSSFK